VRWAPPTAVAAQVALALAAAAVCSAAAVEVAHRSHSPSQVRDMSADIPDMPGMSEA
jgi:hypothetical protein